MGNRVSERQAGGVVAAAWAAPLLIAGFITLPARFAAIGPPSLDASWVWIVNRAAADGLVWGRDLVFTYGPLAWILEPLDIGWHLVVANLVGAALHVAVLVVWIRQVTRPDRRAAALVVPLLLLAAWAFHPTAEAGFTLAALVLLHAAVDGRHREATAVVAAVAATAPFLKLSLGVAVGVIGVGVTAWCALDRSRRLLLPSLVAGALTGLVVTAAVFLRSPWTIRDWGRLSLELMSGYSEAASLIGGTGPLVVGLVVVVALVVAAVVWRHVPSVGPFLALAALVTVLMFRFAFVRQDTSHQAQFLPWVLLVLTALAAVVPRGRDAIVTAGVAGVITVASLVSGVAPTPSPSAVAWSAAHGGGGGRLVANLADLGSVRARLAAIGRERLEPLELPASWRAHLASTPVGTLPWQALWCPANGLAWSPTPTVQLYAAHTAVLDRWSAGRYASDTAPEWILDEYVPVIQRHQALDAPATWLELWRRYEMVEAVTDEPQTVLLRRRPEPVELDIRQVGSTSLRLDDPDGEPVPASEHLLLAAIELSPSLPGRMRRLLWRVPPVYLLLEHASGHRTGYRLIPDTARSGVPLNRFPRDFMGWRALWRGAVDDPVVRFGLGGPGLGAFRSPVIVRWLEVQRGAPPDPEPVTWPSWADAHGQSAEKVTR